MSKGIDQKAYLQKYLSGTSSEKKKRKKKPKGLGLKIVDDDLDLSKLRSLHGDELDFIDQGEDAPQIAGIIDERPEEIRKLEEYSTTSKWRVINQDDGFNNKIQIEEVKKDKKQVEKENEVIFGKMYSDSEDEKKNDSDLSPPRKIEAKYKNVSQGSEKLQNHSSRSKSPLKQYSSSKNSKHKVGNKYNNDSDASPPRQGNGGRKHYDSDISPPRKTSNNQFKSRHVSDESPPRRKKKHNSKYENSDSDMSPPRKPDKGKDKARKHTRWGHFNQEELTMPQSQERRRNKHSNSSPPRKSRKKSPNRYSDSDASPPRKKKHSTETSSKMDRRGRNTKNDKNNYSGTDSSPSRDRSSYNERDGRFSENRKKRNSDSPPPTNKKMARTLEGKLAGLQDGKQLRQENEDFRLREDEIFRKMSHEVSGKNAQVVSRKSKRETSEERQKLKEKAEKQKELDEKYKKWSKGLKQVEAQEERIQDFMHEAAKPLARYKDDRDLESRLRDEERKGDPMLEYMRDKKRMKGELGPEKPIYKGNFAPNRFNIRPGYRWDGVDRSNGYEKKFFEHQSKRKAQEEEAYKWSTEDL